MDRLWTVRALVAMGAVALSAGPRAAAAQAGARSHASARADGVPSAATLPLRERELVRLVRSERIRENTRALTAPRMEGRASGSAGGDRAARLIADQFAALGLTPRGSGGGWFQRVPFLTYQILPQTMFATSGEIFHFADDFVVSSEWSGQDATLRAPLVFVGFGVAADALAHDDLARVDVLDKIVIVARGRPDRLDERMWTDAAAERRVVSGLAGRGAAAIVFVRYETPDQPFEQLRHYATFRNVTPADDPYASAARPPVIIVSDEAARRLFERLGLSLDDEMVRARAGAFVSRRIAEQATLAIRADRERAAGSNVVALLEGSDPGLRSEAVVFSAHYDAYGVKDGQVYSGAADNALGTAMMLSVAEGLAHAPVRPRRSVLFLATTGEEYGLLGAFHWIDHPTWPIRQVVADINFDGIGTETYAPVRRVVGFGAEFSDLGDVLGEVARGAGLSLTDDPFPDQRPFTRSDQAAFAQKGIPAIALLGLPDGEVAPYVARARRWLATDYHQPSDSVSVDWDWSGPSTVASAAMLVGWRVANAARAPRWKPGAPYHRGGKGE